MNIVEPHIHCICRTTDDYERMALAGIDIVVEPAFWLGEPRKHPGTFYDYFDHIANFETERARQFNIAHYATIAVNPREANNRPLAEEVLREMPKWFAHPRVLAVGETGFDDISADEEAIFRRQVEMALAHGLPVMIHTPHRDKKRGVERILAILAEMKAPAERILVDHNNEETTGLVRDRGMWAGHTVYPTKLTPERAAALFRQYGVERMMVNSSADWGASDPLSVPRVVNEMRRQGFPDADVRTLVRDNPLAFYAQSGKISASGERGRNP
ncbi:MAG: TatD family hydrolase [Planctomycetota bacterium]